ncbi:MAG TPA: GntR family transcriptional regulator, partial [Ramlibacter sp.]
MPTPAKKPGPARKGAAASKQRRAPVRLAAVGEPLYRQVVQSLRDEIVRGVYPVGTQLPTEDELTVRFGVSRHTVREALRHLRSDGLVASRQGSGTTVRAPEHSTPFNVHRVASIDELIAYAAESRYVVDRTSIVSSEEAQRDALPPGRRWLRLPGFRQREDPAAPPVCWTEVFIGAEYAGVERMIGRQHGPIWRLIEDLYGERLLEVEQSLSVRPVPEELADGL